MSGDGGTEVVQRISKRDLLRRIEALEREVRELRARPAGWPVPPAQVWPYRPYPIGPAIAGGPAIRAQTGAGAGRNTRLEN